ncbi:THAP domain-containing protein 3 [Coregonus clupeaformis]|uniref:THAP domain-containing protein 3 n=1 Tax=Coregonus clupeaformis TaxID=59861 RepID=UPI001BE0B33E|nr:THAP domain-containing protein 3 [Coregonus clupeaformis]
MPRECAVKMCENKQKTWSALMFHRFPLSNPDRLKLWMVALNKDADTPTEDLRKLLVCSEHFLPGDYYEKLGQDRHTRMRIMKSFLKDTAVPSVGVHTPGQRGIIAVETGDVPPAVDNPPGTDSASPPTPQQSSTHGGSGVATATAGFVSQLGLQLNSRQQTASGTEPASSSGTYVALALRKNIPSKTTTGDACRRKKPKPNVLVERRKKGRMDTAVKTTAVKDCASMRSAEAAGDAAGPSVVTPFTSYSPSASSQGSSSDTSVPGEEDGGGGGGGGGWSERKWIVNESKLKELFQTCHRCGAALRSRTITALGYSQIKVTWSCPDKHRGEWQSCPDAFGVGHYLQMVGYRVVLDSMSSQFLSHD